MRDWLKADASKRSLEVVIILGVATLVAGIGWLVTGHGLLGNALRVLIALSVLAVGITFLLTFLGKK